jgi:hypothetical protein
MSRFLLRHWTSVSVVVILAAWAAFYLPTTPSWTIIQLKRAIDARDGATAGAYVDFPSVVRSAGYQMLQKNNTDGNIISDMIGRGAVDMLSTPMASIAQSWAQHEVDEGQRDVQLPGWAALAAIATMRRDDTGASTELTDKKGQHWVIRFARGDDGRWRIVEVDDIKQLLGKLENQVSSDMWRPQPDPDSTP